MKKQDISVGSLIDMVQRSELVLPQIQRQYVWRAPRVRDLIDSLYRGYPSGSILVWESAEAVPARELAVGQSPSAFESQKLLLDGQQRLTSLTAVLSGKQVTVKGRRRPIDILFNLDHPEGLSEATEIVSDEDALVARDDDDDPYENPIEDEEEDELSLTERLKLRTFVVWNRNMAQLPNWVSVARVFSGDSDAAILKDAGVTSIDDPRFEKYTNRLQRLRRIRDYMYVMHVLERDLSYEEVTEIFVRVNSLGVKLRSSDLALAQISARWPEFVGLLEEFQAECEQSWFTLDTGLLVRAMVVFATKQSKFQRVGSTPVSELKRAWEQGKDGLRFAINFLRTNAGIEDESLLSAPTLMIPIAVFSQLRRNELSAHDSASLLYWLHVANARGRYSRGSSETLLNEDLTILFRGGTPVDMLKPMERLFGRLDVQPSDLAGRPARSPLFALAFLALKDLGAKDWESGLGISLAAIGKQHVIQYHHIFPKALLKEFGYEPGEINEIANLAFIGGRTNQRIGRKSPDVYFAKIVENRGPDALRSQLIPLDRQLHRVENYRAFLEERRKLLSDAINAFMMRSVRASTLNAIS